MLRVPLQGEVEDSGQVSINTDSRHIRKGQVFWAIKGDTFDGHHYVDGCFKKGAPAAVVSDAWYRVHGRAGRLYLPVPDTSRALLQLARAYGRRFTIPKVAITGSNGKTTTKDMLAAVLSCNGSVLATQGNLNNQFGMPFTIFGLNHKHNYAVIEMGSNHPGEIKTLARSAGADTGIITSIGYSHMEHFKTLAGVMREKRGITAGFKHNGLLIVNGDDPYLAMLRGTTRFRVLMCGIHHGKVRAKNIVIGRNGYTGFTVSGQRFLLGMPGNHNINNALLAITTGLEFGVPLKGMAEALSHFSSGAMRMEIKKIGKLLVYNDCYNANPSSVESALKILGAARIRGRCVAVLGDMLELGKKKEALHRYTGEHLVENRIDALFSVGPLAEQIGRGAISAGMAADAIRHFKSIASLNRALGLFLQSGDAVLIKGSRGMRLEKVTTYLEKKHNG